MEERDTLTKWELAGVLLILSAAQKVGLLGGGIGRNKSRTCIS